MKKSKQLILSLIADDLIHHKLVLGLEGLHLTPECYFLNLSDTIIKLMGFKAKEAEKVFEYYTEQLNRVKLISDEGNNKQIQQLAQVLFTELELKKGVAFG